jgi:hypothetical protein
MSIVKRKRGGKSKTFGENKNQINREGREREKGERQDHREGEVTNLMMPPI